LQRIPNPVSDPDVFLRVFREIYEVLKNNTEFTLDDISHAMILRNNVTSQGAIGDEALRRSTRENRSKDPIYNQSKSYAELFRTLGWIQSTSKKLTYAFSFLGIHVATAKKPNLLLNECLLAIAYPNEVLGVQSEQIVRVISSILLTMDELENISRDEIIAGPMSISDDSNHISFNFMINKIRDCRSNSGELDRVIDNIAKNRGITRKPTMENYTRFPIAIFPWTGWGEKDKKGVLHITKKGKEIAKKLKSAPDFRLSDFNNFPDQIKPAFIKISFYSMLGRAGFDITSVKDEIEFCQKTLKPFFKKNYHNFSNHEIYFSPFQQLSRDTIYKYTPELVFESYNKVVEKNIQNVLGAVSNKFDINAKKALIFELSENNIEASDLSNNLINEINKYKSIGNDIEKTTNILYLKYKNANKNTFYPLVANLFCIIGFECRVSRAGQNYERADAIILDSKRSIPIEIKSPSEELEISVKAVRQALENKVILLSRCNYPTDIETTSLVVGFNAPNTRSEVHELINDIKKAFNLRIGIIDFRSLLSFAVHSVFSGKKINLHDFYTLQGVIYAEYITAKL
jgi:hypothetical protein